MQVEINGGVKNTLFLLVVKYKSKLPTIKARTKLYEHDSITPAYPTLALVTFIRIIL